MFQIPKFRVFGEGDSTIIEAIQPRLALRSWSDLTTSEKNIALQSLVNLGLVSSSSAEVYYTIVRVNHDFLQLCPGKRVHNSNHPYERERLQDAFQDFSDIFVNGPELLVFHMLTVLANRLIDKGFYNWAEKQTDDKYRIEYVEKAFSKFDNLAFYINHIFEQFSVNAVLTRSGLVPRQDDRIAEEVYIPTLTILSDPKWAPVNKELIEMFKDFQEKNYPDVIAKGHNVVHKFLQVILGEEGRNEKGAMGKLFDKARDAGILPTNRFTAQIINVFQSHLASERATKSPAKPALEDASPSDALLVMNVVMIFLQYCLQEGK